MSQAVSPPERATDTDLAEQLEKQRDRIDRLETAVEALSDELGVEWHRCPHCADGVVIREPYGLRCTSCEYRSS